MRAALLFDSGHPGCRGGYGRIIRNSILSTDVLQSSGRHVKIRSGDVLIYSHAKSPDGYTRLAERTYFSHPWQLLDDDRLRLTYLRSTVFTWVIQNIDEETARHLHQALLLTEAYLGMHEVDLTMPCHLFFYRNFLISRYRIKGRSCRIFYAMGEEPEEDVLEIEDLKSHGFDDLASEDQGLNDTVFDDCDTPEHFAKCEAFRSLVSRYLPGGQDDADELMLVIEDLDPVLLAMLGDTARAISSSQYADVPAHIERWTQRYFEQFSDALSTNRGSISILTSETATLGDQLRACINSAVSGSGPEMRKHASVLSDAVGPIFDEVATAAGRSSDEDRLGQAFSDLAVLCAAIIQVNPEMARNPYSSFSDRFSLFVQQTLRNTTGETR